MKNVLAERYASPAMSHLWSGEGKVLLERQYWVAVLKAQSDLGLGVPDGVIAAYERVIDQVNLDSIMQRERVTRHDVKARIEEFCDLAGHEHIHKGMTSRDLTENVEQLQVFRALTLIRDRSVAALARFAKLAQRYRDIPLTARTHNVAAQVTTKKCCTPIRPWSTCSAAIPLVGSKVPWARAWTKSLCLTATPARREHWKNACCITWACPWRSMLLVKSIHAAWTIESWPLWSI
jgi:hypothetical protein